VIADVPSRVPPNVSSIGHEHSPPHCPRLFRRTGYFVLCLWSREQGREIHTVTVDTGGFSDTELARIEKLARALGAESAHYDQCARGIVSRLFTLPLGGNVLRGGLYPLSVSAERVCQARRVVSHARQINAVALAHGSTERGTIKSVSTWRFARSRQNWRFSRRFETLL